MESWHTTRSWLWRKASLWVAVEQDTCMGSDPTALELNSHSQTLLPDLNPISCNYNFCAVFSQGISVTNTSPLVVPTRAQQVSQPAEADN